MNFLLFKPRLKQWQQSPVKYEFPGKTYRCHCCGHEHDGNYCPLCGQKSTHGPITWKSVWAGVMEIWGLHSRSLPFTTWQLLFRPGYLIRDYITGKRQVSFPPVKMLVILGVLVYLLGHWLLPKDYTHEIGEINASGLLYPILYSLEWVKVHSEWMSLLVLSSFILPTWWVFRHAPALKRHTLPQGFFIQVFIVNQSLVIDLLLFVLFFFSPSDTDEVGAILMVAYMLVDYKQLFGYSWWGTIWRWLVIVLLILLGILFVGLLVAVTGKIVGLINFHFTGTISGYIFSIVFFAWLFYMILALVDIKNRHAVREHGWWEAFKHPIVATAIVIAIAILMILIPSIV